ncbi:MAG: protein kinase [Candidatus Brocadiae bacterium]|nr:protein kinase [Candidatus Brocadiia bacterium]
MKLYQELQELYEKKDWSTLLGCCEQESLKRENPSQYYYLKAIAHSMLGQMQEAKKNLEHLSYFPAFVQPDTVDETKKENSHSVLEKSIDAKATVAQTTKSDIDFFEKSIDNIETLAQKSANQDMEETKVCVDYTNQEQKKFGRYSILEDLGEGGMGHVYKAFDPELKRIVALKVILGEGKSEKKQIDRFLREAQTTAKLHHPNIVAVYDIGVQDKWPFFTMDFIEGERLDKYIENMPFKSDTISEIFIKIASAIQYAHDNGVIHRDIKPANIMIDKDKQPKVMDFGLAKIEQEDQKISRSGSVLGTPAYMPPEQAQGKEVDARSDIYSLGATLYECLTGSPPFKTNNYTKLVQEILAKDPKAPRQCNPNVPDDLQTICLKCLEKPMGLRYQKMQEVINDLKLFLEYKPIKAKPATLLQKASKWVYRNRKMTFIGMFAICIFFIALFYLRWNFSKTLEKESLLQNTKIFERARKNKEQKRYDLALESFKEIKKGTFFHKEAEKEQEEMLFYLQQNVKQGDAFADKGLSMQSIPDVQKAKEYYEKVLEYYPRHTEVYPKFLNMEKSILEIKNKQHHDARNYYDKGMLIASSPALRKQDLENCYSVFSKAIQTDNTFADAYFQRGKVCQRSFMQERALSDYKQTIALDPGLTNAHYHRILTEYSGILEEISNTGKDQPERKKELFSYLQKLLPHKDDVYVLLVDAYSCIENVKPGGIEQAIYYCDAAEKIAPYFADIYFLRASLHAQFLGEYHENFSSMANPTQIKKNYEKALKDLEKYMEMIPKSTQGYKLRGIIRSELGDLRKAAEDFQYYLGITPVKNMRYEKCVQRLTMILMLLKKYDDAIVYLDKQIEACLKLENAWEYLVVCYSYKALAYIMLKDYKKAKENISSAVELEAKNITIKNEKEHQDIFPIAHFIQSLLSIYDQKEEQDNTVFRVLSNFLQKNFQKENSESSMAFLSELQNNPQFHSMLFHYPNLFAAPPELRNSLSLLEKCHSLDLLEKMKFHKYALDISSMIKLILGWINQTPELENKMHQNFSKKSGCSISLLFLLKISQAMMQTKSLESLEQIARLESADLYYRQALLYFFIKKDISSSIQSLKKACQKDPGFLQAHYALAALYSLESKTNDSLRSMALFHFWMAKKLGWNHPEYVAKDMLFDNLKGSPILERIHSLHASDLKSIAGHKWQEEMPSEIVENSLYSEFKIWQNVQKEASDR